MMVWFRKANRSGDVPTVVADETNRPTAYLTPADSVLKRQIEMFEPGHQRGQHRVIAGHGIAAAPG